MPKKNQNKSKSVLISLQMITRFLERRVLLNELSNFHQHATASALMMIVIIDSFKNNLYLLVIYSIDRVEYSNNSI